MNIEHVNLPINMLRVRMYLVIILVLGHALQTVWGLDIDFQRGRGCGAGTESALFPWFHFLTQF